MPTLAIGYSKFAESTWLGLERVEENYASRFRKDARETVEQFHRTNCRYRPTDSLVPALEYEPNFHSK